MNSAHIGTMGWSYDFWIGDFYPVGSKDLLKEYSRIFSTVEINNTFYRVPSEGTVKNWKSTTDPGFLFSAKFPRKITHLKKLEDCEEDVEFFVERMSILQDRLGPLIIQLPPAFKPDRSGVLKDFLSILPGGYRYALEVRNKKWLEEEFYTMLRDNGIALVLVDHPWMPEMDIITSDLTYIRWEGDRKKVNGTAGKVERDRTSEIKNWANKIQGFLENDVEVFGYFSKSYSGFPPGDVKMMLEFLKKV